MDATNLIEILKTFPGDRKVVIWNKESEPVEIVSVDLAGELLFLETDDDTK